jgi:hypothetical protein
MAQMAMGFDSLLHGLMLASVWLQGSVAASLLAKKMWKVFPVFTVYSIVTFSGNLALYLLRGHQFAYFYVYWSGEIAGLVLGFGVVYEVFQTLLRGHSALRQLASRAFLAVLAGLILLALVVVYTQPSGEKARIMAGILISAEATRLVELGFIAFLFVFSKAFGLHWRQSVFGVALGLGIFVSAELIGLAMRLQFGSQAGPTFNVVRAMSFNASLLIWIGYVFIPERIATPAGLPKPAQLQQWNEAIMELIHQ